MTVVAALALTVLGVAAAIVVFRIFRGPSNLDRIVAAEILMIILIAGVAAQSAWQRTATNLPLLLVLGLVGFVGGVAVTRFMSRDVDDLDVDDSDRPSDPRDPTEPEARR